MMLLVCYAIAVAMFAMGYMLRLLVAHVANPIDFIFWGEPWQWIIGGLFMKASVYGAFAATFMFLGKWLL